MGSSIDEIKNRSHFVEGNPYVDNSFHNIRVTHLISLMSIFILWRKDENIENDEIEASIREFVLENKKYLNLWGEAVVPQFLSFYWYYRKIDSSPEADGIIVHLINHLCNPNEKN